MRAVEKRLRQKIKDLEQNLLEVESDRNLFRTFLARNIREAINIHGRSQYWNMVDLIETFAKQIAQVKWWYW